MSELHLAAGSQQPPLVQGKLRLYSMEYCPYAQRSRLVLNAKKIPHDIVNIHLGNKPEWYFKINPQGKVPAIDTGSEVVVESLDIAEWLDKKYPENPLSSKDPEVKKRDQELIQKIDAPVQVFYKCIAGREKKSPEEWVKEFAPLLEPFESELAKRGTFFGGDKPGMVDYMLWPWGERAPLVALTLGLKTPLLGDDKFPLLKKWRKAMREDPASKATYNAPEKHWKLIQTRLNGQTVDYDKL